jgi:hypothetical protein
MARESGAGGSTIKPIMRGFSSLGPIASVLAAMFAWRGPCESKGAPCRDRVARAFDTRQT